MPTPDSTSTTPLRVIHVGVGGRGRWPLDVLGSDPRFQSAALVDVAPANLAAARETTGLPNEACFTSVQDALTAVDAADALVVCTPTKTHAAMCRAGFTTGKHVLVEKGMTLDWPEANALVAEAESAGVAFCVSQNYRYMAETRTLANLLQHKTHGTPHLIDLIHHRYRPEPRTLDYPFAMVWDMGCHHFDNLVSLFGPVERITAVTHSAPWSAYAPHDAGVTAVLEFRSGPVCTYQLTHQATLSTYRHLLQTERGALIWEQPSTGAAAGEGAQRRGPDPGQGVRGQGGHWTFLPKPDRQLGRTTTSEPIPNVATTERSEQGVVDDWHRLIKEGAHAREIGISGRNNLETLAVCEMIVRAATQRRPVTRSELQTA